jgi:MerR family transcriptional regulator, light-induced transcriptional regulator
LNGWTPILNPIEALADEAADWITEQIYIRYAEVLSPFGARGRFQTRQDLRYHVEFLGAAVEVRAPGYFTDYVLWLAGVLKARGVPVQTLAESLQLLRKFLEGRLQPELLVAAQESLDAGLAALAADWEASAPRYQARMPEPDAAVGAFTRCLLDGDSAAARAIVLGSSGSSGISGSTGAANAVPGDVQPGYVQPGYVQIATHLFQPALYAIGQKWERNEITVAQEHLATAIAQTLLVELFLKGPFQPPGGQTVLLAGIEHNHHVMGLRMLADVYELAGWSVQYLGANTPTQALLAQVDKAGPDLVGLSASLVQQLPALRHCVSALKSEFRGRCPVIMVGGIPTNQFEGVWWHLGADAWAPDAETAIALST